jgi:hypothetical protein
MLAAGAEKVAENASANAPAAAANTQCSALAEL